MHLNNSKYTYRLVDEGKEWGSLSTKNKVNKVKEQFLIGSDRISWDRQAKCHW